MKIILSGCHGAMGKKVVELINSMDSIEIIAGVDYQNSLDMTFDVYPDFKSCSIKADAIIDFSHFSVINDLIDYALQTRTPAVICTTGLDEETNLRLKKASEKVAIFKSGNMSLGINLLMKLAQMSTKFLEDSFDIEIIEKHHNKKIDAPSGTALMLADCIKKASKKDRTYNYGRQGNNAKRKLDEIGIHSIRGGSIVGQHDILFAGIDETIELKHTAQSKKVFAKGAITAAMFIQNKQPGYYNMNDII